MAASTTGPKASTSKRDKGAPVRRQRVMQALMMQGLVAVLLVGLSYLSRSDPQMMRIYLASILIPVGWTFAIWRAFTRGEAARRTGAWTKEFDARERNVTYAIMGGAILLWAAAVAAIVLLA